MRIPCSRLRPPTGATLRGRKRPGSVGNTVKAAILRVRAARVALPDRAERMRALAIAELKRLVRRLQRALGLSDEATKRWVAALIPVLQRCDRGIRTVEARLLYDLQKVCIENERGVFRIDLAAWCRALGRAPLRRPLPLLRETLVTKHLQNAARKLTTSRLTGTSRERLAQLIDAAVAEAQQRLRDDVRPLIAETLLAEDLRPRNVPERVAFRKIVEELLDRIVRQGYLSFGHIRDTLSKNNLKLSDLTRVRELLTGDVLLRIDRRLDTTLDGVYHHGPIYLRWSHRLSALAFGTQFGRFVTRFLALPFGGAFLTVEGLRHVVHLFEDHDAEVVTNLPPAEGLDPTTFVPAGDAVKPDVLGVTQVLLLGIFLLMLLENAAFRQWFLAGLAQDRADGPQAGLRLARRSP